MRMLLSNIRKLIADDKLSEAIELIIKVIENENYTYMDEAVLISRELHSFFKAKLSGKMTWKQESIIENKIASRILQLAKVITSN